MRWKMRILGLALMATAIFTAGCESEPSVPPTSVSPLATPETAITDSPAATEILDEADSPLPAPETSPVVGAITLEGRPFSIDEPLRQNDTQVSGTGPHDIPIIIADLTLLGETLGRGKVGPDGHFTVPVTPPLIVNHRIGILLDAQATDIQHSEELIAQLETFRGDDTISIPRIGTAYDAASVQP